MRNRFILNLVLTQEKQLEIQKIMYCVQHEEKNLEMSGFFNSAKSTYSDSTFDMMKL